MDNSKTFAYDESLLGKCVFVKCVVEHVDGREEEEAFYKATIVRMTSSYPNDDMKQGLVRQHYLKFSDGEVQFYDLQELESTGCLIWEKEKAVAVGPNNGEEQVSNKPSGGEIEQVSNEPSGGKMKVVAVGPNNGEEQVSNEPSGGEMKVEPVAEEFDFTEAVTRIVTARLVWEEEEKKAAV